jgi:hypothetical protein
MNKWLERNAQLILSVACSLASCAFAYGVLSNKVEANSAANENQDHQIQVTVDRVSDMRTDLAAVNAKLDYLCAAERSRQRRQPQ